MNVLAEIYRPPQADPSGRTVSRTAVRAIILRGRDLLLVRVAMDGYKFPGGGVDEGESQAEALRREILEECGATLIRIGDEVGAVVEYKFAFDEGFDTFKMTSCYFLCDVADDLGPQNLDAYEADLGFEPCWVSIDEALRENHSLLEAESAPDWLKREVFVLEYLQNQTLF
jgi:8-oxo-dGTP pyrophosphatase MutT (NUDIX family)